MSFQSHYRINVAKRSGVSFTGGDLYSHLFATAPDSGAMWSADKALMMLEMMQEKFPAPEYKVDMTHWRCSGVDVTR